jgi:hypothetical protein
MLEKDKFGNLLYMPTREEVESVKEGDLLLSCFGRMERVKNVAYRGTDIHGRAYVGVYLEWGADASISSSYKEGELFITVPLSFAYKSDELRAIECEMRARMEKGERK